MPIDWFTVAAQAINFLILVGLLKHFLYGPIVRAMDEREERIAGRLEDAEREHREADEQRQQLERERSNLEERREEILAGARKEADEQREQALRDAREEARRRREAWDRELVGHGQDVVEELLGLMGDRLSDGLRAAFSELADADVQTAAVARFVHELGELEGTRRDELEEAFADDDLAVHLAREPSDQQRTELLQALADLGADRQRVDFVVDDALIGGVEVRAGGRRVAWSLRRFIEDADEAMQSFIRETRQESMESSEDRQEDDGSRAAKKDGDEAPESGDGAPDDAEDEDDEDGGDAEKAEDDEKARDTEHHHAG